MSLSMVGTAVRRDSERSNEFLSRALSVSSIAAASVLTGLLVIGTYFLFRDPSDLHALERQRVVDQIAQFHTQHGRYPKSLNEAGIVLDRLGCDYYEAGDEFFFIELYRRRIFSLGRTTWSYNSQKGQWSCYAEPH